MKRLLAGIALTTGLFLFTASVAFAGEVNGKGEAVPATGVAASSCVYSGLEDGDGSPPGPQSGETQTPAVVAGTGIPGQGAIIPDEGFSSCNPQDTTPGPGL
jgi:hypothetical protein